MVCAPVNSFRPMRAAAPSGQKGGRAGAPTRIMRRVQSAGTRAGRTRSAPAPVASSSRVRRARSAYSVSLIAAACSSNRAKAAGSFGSQISACDPPASGKPPSRVIMHGTPRCRASMAARPKPSPVFGGTTIHRAFWISAVLAASSTKPRTRAPRICRFSIAYSMIFRSGPSPISTSGHRSRSISAMA